MKYSNEMWAKCRWRIDTVPIGEKIHEHYPELAELFKPILKAYTEASAPLSADQLIRYIVLTYHRFSPYAVNEQNIIKRKIEVCEYVWIDVNKTPIESVIANKNRFVNNAVIYFLKQEADMDWLELQQYLDAYFQIMEALTDGTTESEKKTTPQDIAKVKLAIVKDMKEIKREIEVLSARVFRDDNDMLGHVERYKKAEEENFVVLSPEQFVKSKREKEE